MSSMRTARPAHLILLDLIILILGEDCLLRCPRGVRSVRSSIARTLGSWINIPLRHGCRVYVRVNLYCATYLAINCPLVLGEPRIHNFRGYFLIGIGQRAESIKAEDCKLWNSSLHSFLQPHVTSSLLVPDVLLSTQSQTPWMYVIPLWDRPSFMPRFNLTFLGSLSTWKQKTLKWMVTSIHRI
jgi:hypothetical protein